MNRKQTTLDDDVLARIRAGQGAQLAVGGVPVEAATPLDPPTTIDGFTTIPPVERDLLELPERG
jgi:hypothetical protein